jgi:hypothetical protein
MKPALPVTIPGWHSEPEAAAMLGESLQTRRRNRRAGIGPRWVRHGRRVLYEDGSEAAYLAGLQEKAEAASEPRGRGRPRKAA